MRLRPPAGYMKKKVAVAKLSQEDDEAVEALYFPLADYGLRDTSRPCLDVIWHIGGCIWLEDECSAYLLAWQSSATLTPMQVAKAIP